MADEEKQNKIKVVVKTPKEKETVEIAPDATIKEVLSYSFINSK